MIIKQIRKRANRELAAPLTTTTALSIPEVVAVIRRICEQYNQTVSAELAEKRTTGNKLKRLAAQGTKDSTRHYHVQVRDKDVLIGYELPPAHILNKAKYKIASWTAGWWLAMVRFPKPAEPLPDGHYLVEVRLINWVMNDDGKLGNQDKYEAFTDTLWEAVSREA